MMLEDLKEIKEEIKELSGGQLEYWVVDTMKIRRFPKLIGNQQYDSTRYNNTIKNSNFAIKDSLGSLAMMDYEYEIHDLYLEERIESGLCDEIWLHGGPYFGFFESRMIGRKSYWCNSPPLISDSKRFIVMGFNYERSVTEMLHSFSHRVESILAKKYCSQKFIQNLYRGKVSDRRYFLGFRKWLMEVGTVHRIPGGEVYSQNERYWLSQLKSNWWKYLSIAP